MPEQIAIGLVLPLHHEIGQHSLRGILRYAAEHPEIRLLDFCFFRDEDDLEAPRRPPPWIGQTDGVVLQLSKSPGVVEYIQSGGVPAVNAFADLSNTPIASVYTDGRSLAHVAIEHLCAVGFRSIACVAHNKKCHRRKAYREDLKKRGRKLLAAVDDIQLFHHWADESFDINAVRPSLAKLIESAKKPLGIVTINDFIAIVVCRVVKSLGLRIPDDVGVLGVGDMSIAEINSPPLSTMRVPSDSIGYEAVRRVHQMIEGRGLTEKNFTVAGVKLVARSSTVGEQRATQRRHQDRVGSDSSPRLRRSHCLQHCRRIAHVGAKTGNRFRRGGGPHRRRGVAPCPPGPRRRAVGQHESFPDCAWPT